MQPLIVKTFPVAVPVFDHMVSPVYNFKINAGNPSNTTENNGKTH